MVVRGYVGGTGEGTGRQWNYSVQCCYAAEIYIWQIEQGVTLKANYY